MKAKAIGCLQIGWLVEAYYLRLFLQLYKIPHYTTLQKFTDRINQYHDAWKDNFFIYHLYRYKTHIFIGIDATGFKITYASEYYVNRFKLRKTYTKLSFVGADVLKQIICRVKIRRAPIPGMTISISNQL